jgi:hypothetical protein
MCANHVNVVLVHGAWADGSSWSKVISGPGFNDLNAVTAPLPLTTLADDVAALDRTLTSIHAWVADSATTLDKEKSR